MNGSGYLKLRSTHERGMTTFGFLILVSIIGMFVFADIPLTPVYLNYVKVAGVLDGVYDEFDNQNPTRGAIRTSIKRRFEVESVSVISSQAIKVRSESGGFLVVAQYDHTSPFVANIHFTVQFDKEVLIRR